MEAGSRRVRVVFVGLLIAMALTLSACAPPPVITQAQFDAKKTPKHHPQLTEKLKNDCKSCHKVVPNPAVKK